MKQWAYDCRIQINQSIYLEQEIVKAIVEFRFNPGKGVSHLASASKGVKILACRACTTAETERVRKQEFSLSATENTHQLEDLL
jgi:Holliday junction resolvase